MTPTMKRFLDTKLLAIGGGHGGIVLCSIKYPFRHLTPRDINKVVVRMVVGMK